METFNENQVKPSKTHVHSQQPMALLKNGIKPEVNCSKRKTQYNPINVENQMRGVRERLERKRKRDFHLKRKRKWVQRGRIRTGRDVLPFFHFFYYFSFFFFFYSWSAKAANKTQRASLITGRGDIDCESRRILHLLIGCRTESTAAIDSQPAGAERRYAGHGSSRAKKNIAKKKKEKKVRSAPSPESEQNTITKKIFFLPFFFFWFQWRLGRRRPGRPQSFSFLSFFFFPFFFGVAVSLPSWHWISRSISLWKGIDQATWNPTGLLGKFLSSPHKTYSQRKTQNERGTSKRIAPQNDEKRDETIDFQRQLVTCDRRGAGRIDGDGRRRT